jgi:hypothetical protein
MELQTVCRVADPTGTPLNVRTLPNGKIIGNFANGTDVSILDSTIFKNKQWVFIQGSSHEEVGDITVAGWVFRDFLAFCHTDRFHGE